MFESENSAVTYIHSEYPLNVCFWYHTFEFHEFVHTLKKKEACFGGNSSQYCFLAPNFQNHKLLGIQNKNLQKTAQWILVVLICRKKMLRRRKVSPYFNYSFAI